MPEQIDSNDARAYIFFSVDIVDSSSYKSTFVIDWGRDFNEFFTSFPIKLNGMCANFKIPRHEDMPIDLPYPEIWKFNGDEILFFIDICKAFDILLGKHNDKLQLERYELVLYYTILFRRTIIDYNKGAEIKQKKHLPAFKIKLAAWFADVKKGPHFNTKYGNIEIESNNVKSDNKVDFIGRQIDIGFRISECSTLNRFIISAEYLIVLLRDNYLTIEDEGIRFYYEGRKTIKGTLEHLGYPIIYIDMEDNLEHTEISLLYKDIRPANQISLMRMMEEYIKRTNNALYTPFIHKSDRFFNEEL